jgi:hypothetical protein
MMIRSFNRVSALVASTAALVCAAAPQSAAQVSISPLVVEQAPGSVVVANAGNAPVRLRVRAYDFDHDATGRTIRAAHGSTAHSCAGRVRVGAVPTLIQPRSQHAIELAITDGGRSCWTLLELAFAHDTVFGHAVGVKVYFTRDGEPRGAEVTGVSLQRTSQGAAIAVAIRNTGPAAVRPRGKLQVRREDGGTVAEVQVPDFSLHPGRERTLTVPVPATLPAGTYSALVILDIGTDQLVAAQGFVELTNR